MGRLRRVEGREPFGNRFEGWQSFDTRRQQELAEAIENRKERQANIDQFPAYHVPPYAFTKHDHASFDVGQLKEFLGHNAGAAGGVWHRVDGSSLAQERRTMVTAAETASPEFRVIQPLGGVPSDRTNNGTLPTLRAYSSVPFRLLNLPQRFPCFREVREHLLPPSALILAGVLLVRVRSVLGGALTSIPRHVWCGGRF